MTKLYQICCPKCNNKTDFYCFGKDKHGYQKYQCKKCKHQWAPQTPSKERNPNYPLCPACGKATFLHHGRQHYAHDTCCDKKCRHSVFVPKPTVRPYPNCSARRTSNGCATPSMWSSWPWACSTWTRTHFAISPWFCGLWWISRSSTRPSATGVPVSPRCSKTSLYSSFRRSISTLTSGTPMKPSLRYREILPLAHSGQWEALCLSPHRNSPQAFTILDAVKPMGTPQAIVSDCYFAQMPVKTLHGVKHIRLQSFQDDNQQPHRALQQAV